MTTAHVRKTVCADVRCFRIFFAALLCCFCAPAAFADTPQHGDTMIYGMLGEAANLIPHLASDSASSAIASNFYVAPLKIDKDLNFVPHAAEQFEVLNDGRLLRFTLRKGIYWQDGVELTADDALFTYERMIDPATPTAYSGDYKIIKEFRKTGRYSFEVEYEHPFPRSLSTWCGGLWPKHALEGQDLRATPLKRAPLSCGPYLMGEWKSGSSISMDANPAYFEGQPYIDRLLFRIIPDMTTMFLELKAGKLDIMSPLTPLQYLRQTKNAAFAEEFNTYETLDSTYVYLGYNLKSPLFSDIRVRRALAHGINKQDIVKGSLLGLGVPTIGPYKPDSWTYNSAIQDYAYDPELALRLLREAGWSKDRNGVLQKEGLPFSFTILTNQGNEQRIKTAVIIQSQLRKLGIEAKLRTVEWAAFIKQFVEPGHFDAIILGWTIPVDPDGYDIWHSSRMGGGLNFIGYANADVDACLDAGRATLDKAERKKYYDRLQELLHHDQPYCFLYVPYATSAVQKRFRGIEPAPAGIFHNTNQWWVPLNEQRYRVTAQ